MALLLAPLPLAYFPRFSGLAIFAGLLVALYFLLLKPAIDSGEKKVSHSLHSLEKKASPKRLEHCLGHADGDVEEDEALRAALLRQPSSSASELELYAAKLQACREA